MDRRELVLSGIGALASFGLVQNALAADKKSNTAKPSTDHEKLIAAASGCIAKGKTCLAHCIDMLADGHKEMGDCAKLVNEMLAMCDGLVTLASSNSTYLPKYAALCAKVCEACEKACRKHADHHEVCKACADSCVECVKQCKAVG